MTHSNWCRPSSPSRRRHRGARRAQPPLAGDQRQAGPRRAPGRPIHGGHASFAFGLALAQPDVKVVLFDSEGDLLMNLGALPTIAEKAPRNFYHFVMDNECYATTGGQPVPNSRASATTSSPRGRATRPPTRWTNPGGLRQQRGRILEEPGPVLVALKIVPEVENLPIGSGYDGRRGPWKRCSGAFSRSWESVPAPLTGATCESSGTPRGSRASRRGRAPGPPVRDLRLGTGVDRGPVH